MKGASIQTPSPPNSVIPREKKQVSVQVEAARTDVKPEGFCFEWGWLSLKSILPCSLSTGSAMVASSPAFCHSRAELAAGSLPISIGFIKKKSAFRFQAWGIACCRLCLCREVSDAGNASLLFPVNSLDYSASQRSHGLGCLLRGGSHKGCRD